MSKVLKYHSKLSFSFLQFEYQYEVKDPEKMLFFDKNEVGDAEGKVINE